MMKVEDDWIAFATNRAAAVDLNRRQPFEVAFLSSPPAFDHFA
jgi:hypothetical protein